MLSPAGIPTGSFSTSASRSAAEALCRPSSTGLENGLSTRIVPEPGLLCLKWKIQLEENTTSHSPEHVGWRCRRARFIKVAGNFRLTGSYPASTDGISPVKSASVDKFAATGSLAGRSLSDSAIYRQLSCARRTWKARRPSCMPACPSTGGQTQQTFTPSRWIWYSRSRNLGCTPSAERDYPP
jgi:hypothetical protein